MAGVAKTKKAPEVFISEADEYLFAQGTHYDIYKKLGAHPSVENGKKGMFFAVWAPHALQVHVFGTFNLSLIHICTETHSWTVRWRSCTGNVKK